MNPDDPLEYEPDDTEPQRIAEQFTEAAAEYSTWGNDANT